MRLTLTVELNEGEKQRAPHVKQLMQKLHSNVDTRFITDKNALANKIIEGLNQKQFEVVAAELEDRLGRPEYVDDCLDTFCSVVFLNSQRETDPQFSSCFFTVVKQLPEEQRELVKKELVKRAMDVLSTPRRLDCSRHHLLSYAETLACMVKMELLSVKLVIATITQMIRLETTRTAGMTCLGKLVEIAFNEVRSCDSAIISSLRSALISAQQGDTFLYDVEYIVDAFGWGSNRSPLTLCRSGVHHKSPILAMAYSGGSGAREVVVTSSVDGCIGTWDGSGGLKENIVLSRHYASSLDIAQRGHMLLVGSIGRNSSTPPAVILYTNKDGMGDSKWAESGGVEPAGAQFITAVRGINCSSAYRFCVGVHTKAKQNPLLIYEGQKVLQEFHDHTDILTALHVPSGDENTILTGSRDSTVCQYDLRVRNLANTFTHHTNTITSITASGDLLFTAGLDKRVIIQDFRMGGVLASRDMDSAILDLSVSPNMHCAVSTLTGIHFVPSAQATNTILPCFRIDSGPSAPRYNALLWNSTGNILYAGGDNQSLDVYRYDLEFD